MTSAAVHSDCRAHCPRSPSRASGTMSARSHSRRALPPRAPLLLCSFCTCVWAFLTDTSARFGSRVVEDRKLRLRQRPPSAPRGRRAAGRAQRAHERAAVHGGGGGLGDDHVKIAPADLVERGLTGFHGRGLAAVFDQQVKQPPGQRVVVLRSRIFMAWPPLLPA